MHPFILWSLLWLLCGLWPGYLTWQAIRAEGFRRDDALIGSIIAVCFGPVGIILFQRHRRQQDQGG